MKRFLYGASLVGSFLVAACHKVDGPTQASGQVVDGFTQQPVPGATVQVIVVSGGGPLGSNTGGAGSTVVQADGQGRFSLNFEADKNYNYSLQASTRSGYLSDPGALLLKAGQRYEDLILRAAAPAWVKVIGINDPPAASVTISIGGYNGQGDYFTAGPNGFSFTPPTISNRDLTLLWEIQDRANTIRKQQPYRAGNFDTTTVTIRY